MRQNYDSSIEDICRLVWKGFLRDLEARDKMVDELKSQIISLKNEEDYHDNLYANPHQDIYENGYHGGYALACGVHAAMLQRILDHAQRITNNE